MEGSDALAAIAEISLGLAGFTGIVVAFITRSAESTRYDSARALFLLLTGFGALVLSLLPFGLHFAGLSEPDVWRVASGTMAAYFLVFLLSRRGFTDLDWSKIPHSTVFVRISWIGGAFNVFLQLSNLWFGQLSIFFFGLLWYLVYGCFQFATILYFRPRP